MKKYGFSLLITFIAITVLFQGCRPALETVAGVNEIVPVYPADLPDIAIKHNLSPDNLFLLDTAAYKNFLAGYQDTSVTKHNLYQPLQIMAFNSSGKKHLHLVNCMVGGFPGLNWNKYKTFNRFPLSPGKFGNADTLVNLQKTLSFFYFTGNKDRLTPQFNDDDEIIVVFISEFMEMQSGKLIGLVKGYMNKYPEKNIRTFYVITDNLYLDDKKK